MRAIIIGAGPAGLYTARALLSRTPQIAIDILDRLPTPFGLIRYGVSPDHPHTKNAINTLSPILAHPNVTFHGNLHIPPSQHAHLSSLAHIVIWATGAQKARSLNSDGVLADDFAKWVNGHPELAQDVRHNIEHNIKERVAVIGVGNVALDVARMLLRPAADFQHTDISPRALDVLNSVDVQHVTVVGRKNPARAAWTTAALREVVTKIPDVTCRVSQQLVQRDMQMVTERKRKRTLQVLAKCEDENVAVATSKTLDFKFLYAPSDIVQKEHGVTLSLEPQNDALQPIELDADAAFLSLGYVGGSGPGVRVGWANGKATGIIGDNLHSAEEVVAALPRVVEEESKPGLTEWLKEEGREVVDWKGWLRIDEEERKRGKEGGREEGKIKIESIDEMLALARGPAPT